MIARLWDHRLWVTGLGVAAFVMTIVMFGVLPMTFQPSTDDDTSTATIEMVPGTTLDQTDAVVKRVATLLGRQPEVASVYARTGQNGAVNTGRVTASLKDQRSKTSTQFERDLAPQLAAIPDARVAFRSQFGFGTSSRDVNVTLGGDDPVLLQQTADKIVAQMSKLTMISAPRVSGNLQRPEIVIRPRLDLAANLGVTTEALSSAIRIATLGDIDQNSAKFSLSDRQVPIRVALDQNARTSLSDDPEPARRDRHRRIGAAQPGRRIGLGSGPTKIDRVNQQRQISLGADLAPGVVSGVANKAIHDLPR